MRGSFNGKITGFHPVVKGSIPLPRTSYALVSLVVEVRSCKAGVLVRFRPGAPSQQNNVELYVLSEEHLTEQYIARVVKWL